MRRAFSLSILIMATSLGGCLSVPPQTQALWMRDIDLALGTAPARLQMLADGGDEQAMAAFAVVLRYGLNGAARDPDMADSYAAKATRPTGSHTTFIWMPKTKDGGGGYAMPVTTSTYDYHPARAVAVEACAALLAPAGDPPGLGAQLHKGICGGMDNYRRLKALWHGAPDTHQGGRL